MRKKILLLAALFIAALSLYCAPPVVVQEETVPAETQVPPVSPAAPESQREPEEITCADLAYTIEYPEAWDYYRENKADPATKATTESASFTEETIEEIHEALETKKIVVLNGEFTGETGFPKSFSGVLTALNLAADPDGNHNVCLMDIENGREVAGRIRSNPSETGVTWNVELWYSGWIADYNDLSNFVIPINSTDTWDRPHDVEFCYPNVTTIAFNVARAPFDDVEVRRAFAHAFDKERFMRESYGSIKVRLPALYLPV